MTKLPFEQSLQIKLVRTREGHELWKTIERDIQLQATKKDKSFQLTGFAKEFVRDQDKLRVYLVDGNWIRNNISIIFGHGGHGLVHEFIPLDEIWIDYKHRYLPNYERCSCRNLHSNENISEQFFNETVEHEIVEFKEMKKGIPYWRAHITATKAEVGL